jgi:hypothetical protein
MSDSERLAQLLHDLAAAETHRPCCSTHDVHMTCERYRRTHFVEVRPCCAIDAARLRAEERR